MEGVTALARAVVSYNETLLAAPSKLPPHGLKAAVALRTRGLLLTGIVLGARSAGLHSKGKELFLYIFQHQRFERAGGLVESSAMCDPNSQ